jgi:hypothetical protein
MTDEFQVLVERQLKMKRKSDGLDHDLFIQIGHPYTTDPDGDAACPVAIMGLHGRLADVHGIDRLDALRLAIELVESVLRGRATDTNFFWPDGEEYVGK